MSNTATDSNSNAIGVQANTNVTVSTVSLDIAANSSHEVFVTGQFSADCSGATGGIVVASILVDSNLRLNTQINNLEGDTGTILSLSGVVSLTPGKHRLDLSAFAENLQFVSTHHHSLSVVDLDADLRFVANIMSLTALAAGVVPCLTVLGYYAPGDGGGGTFYWDASATEPSNAGTIFVPASNPPMGRWKRLGADHACDIEVRWFGAKGDATADDTAAIRSAITTAVASGQNPSVVFGKGIFLYSATIFIPCDPSDLKSCPDPGNKGITLIGSRDAAAQQGSARPATVLRWTGGTVPTFKIASTFTTFKDMAVENVGCATYFAEVEPSGAGRVRFYGVSCYSGASGPTLSKPFSDGFLKTPQTDYNRIERCEFSGAAPAIVDMEGTKDLTSGTTTFYFVDNVLDTSFDTDVFRIKNCPFELLKIAHNTFNAQPNAYDPNDKFYSNLGLIYAGSGLTVVNSMDIDKDHVDETGYVLGNLVFKDNEYDDSAYDRTYDFDNAGTRVPHVESDQEKQRLAGVRMLKLLRTLNVDLENNNMEGNGQNTALIELTDSVAHVGNNFAHSIGTLLRTLDPRPLVEQLKQRKTASRVFFKANNMNVGNVAGLINNLDTTAGIVAMSPKPATTRIPIHGNYGDPSGETTYKFDAPDKQDYTIYYSLPADPVPGYMTRGQKVTVMIRNTSGDAMGTIIFEPKQFKTSGPFISPTNGKNRSISFVFDGTYMVEIFRTAGDVSN